MIDSHSQDMNEGQLGALEGSRRAQTSAVMLGIALSFGATAPLLSEPELALAAGDSAVSGLSTVDSDTDLLVPRLTADTADSASTTYHTVEEGESLWQIAEQHHADVQAIKQANGISPEEVLRVGQVIRVPGLYLATAAEAVDGPRLALSATVRGGVGGDLSMANPEGNAVAVLSVAELEQAWGSSDDMSLPLHEDDEELGEDLAQDEAEEDEATLSAQDEEDSRSQLAALLPQGDVSDSAIVLPTATPSTDIQVEPKVEQRDEPATTATPLAPLVSRSETVTVEDRASWQDASTQTDPERAVALPEIDSPEPQPSANHEPSSTPLTVAVLDPEATSEPGLGAASKPVSTRTYQVKPGDTLWSVAARHGLSAAELLSHNETVQQPDRITVGDQLSIPLVTSSNPTQAAAAMGGAATPAAEVSSREAEIRSHLARIRAAASTPVDRAEINARIREARLELERTRSSSTSVASSAQTQSLALASSPSPSAVRETPGQATAAVEAQRDAQQATDAADGWVVTDVAESTSLAATEIALRSDIAEPVDASPSVMEADSSQQLLAAAPLGADVYRSNPNLPVGQTVSPNMPMLPGASEFLPEAPNRFNGYVWPTQGTFTSGYGWRWGRMHRGVDIAGPVGTPIVAAASGVVVSAGWNSGGYGNMVDIRHADGSLTRYAHNSRLMVRSGEQVNQGQQIAAMGSTGFSTGPHLHFEIHLPNSGTVNPMAYLPGR